MTPRSFLPALALALLPACGAAPATVSPAPEAAAPAGSAAPSSAPAGDTAAPTEGAAPAEAAPGAAEAHADAAPSDAASLARDFLKAGGRRIAYSAQKKSFAYSITRHQDNGSFSLDVHFIGEDGSPKDVLRVCQPGECEEKLDEIAKTFIPKLAARFEEQGYVGVRGIGWPSGRDELEVSSLGMKLKYARGRLDGVREGKPAVHFMQVGGKHLDTPTLDAIFVVPETKLLGVFASPAASPNAADFYILKVP